MVSILIVPGIVPGSILQLIVAFIFALVSMLVTAVVRPFRSDTDDYVATAFGFALVAVFFFALIIKVSVLREDLESFLVEDQRDEFEVNIVVVSVGMTIAVAIALVVTAIVAMTQLVHAAQAPIIKLRSTSRSPALTIKRGITWHMFLSHIWSTGQDQCATIKRQLSTLLSGVSIFLDVDDLQEIDALEEYIDRSQVIMLFVSKGYFKSANCLREARSAIDRAKPLALVHDPVRGGAALRVIREEECPADMQAIFDTREVI